MSLVPVGSSYSTRLLMLIVKHTNKVKTVTAFSQVECHKGISIQNELKDLAKPTLVTASLQETKTFITLVNNKETISFLHYMLKQI